MLWLIAVGTAYGSGSASVNSPSSVPSQFHGGGELPYTLPDLQTPTEEEKEILRLWDKTVKELERISSPFGLPVPKGDGTTSGSEQSSCSANCSAGSCSVSCYGVVICGCTSSGAPVCRCKDSGIVPTGKSRGSHSGYGENKGNFKVSAIPGGIEITTPSNVKTTEVSIWDVSGRLVARFTFKGRKALNLKRGLYFVKVGHKVKKVIVK